MSGSNQLKNEIEKINANQENEEDSDSEFYSSIYDTFSKSTISSLNIDEKVNQNNGQKLTNDNEMKIRKIIYGDQNNVLEDEVGDCFEQIELPDSSSLKLRSDTVQYQLVKKINFTPTAATGTILYSS